MTDVPDESTIQIRRAPADEPDGDRDGVTEVSARRGMASEGTTEPSGSDTAEPPGPRRRWADPDAADPDADEGSTIVARRESRRRASRAVDSAPAADAEAATVVVAKTGASRGLAATLAGDVPAPLGRVAQAPTQTGAAYATRPAEPLIVARAMPEARAPQPTIDVVATQEAARRRTRRRAATVVTLSLVAVLAAAAAILILLTL